mgnify:CR=1 FL=1
MVRTITIIIIPAHIGYIWMRCKELYMQTYSILLERVQNAYSLPSFPHMGYVMLGNVTLRGSLLRKGLK